MLESVIIEPEKGEGKMQRDALLAQLQDQKSKRYDPVRLRFIESLLTRSKNENKRVRQLLEGKARQAFNTYQIALASEKANAEKLLLEIEKNVPDIFEQAQCYFEQDDFDGLKQVFNQQRLHGRSKTGLAELTEDLLNRSDCDDQGEESQLNELLLQQEIKALQSVSSKIDNIGSASTALSSQKPLKANLRYQQSQQKQQLNRFMASVMAAKPSNPGPLNPERLAIELLREMYSLSPEYFNHCVANIETLLWLEKKQNILNKK